MVWGAPQKLSPELKFIGGFSYCLKVKAPRFEICLQGFTLASSVSHPLSLKGQRQLPESPPHHACFLLSSSVQRKMSKDGSSHLSGVDTDTGGTGECHLLANALSATAVMALLCSSGSDRAQVYWRRHRVPEVLLSFHPVTAHRSVFAFKSQSQAAKSCWVFKQMLRKSLAVALEERQILLRQWDELAFHV